MSPRVCEVEDENTVPGRQGQRPEYQEEGSGGRRLSGWRGVAAFSAQGTRVLKQPRLCLSRRAPSRSHGLLRGGRGEVGQGTGGAGVIATVQWEEIMSGENAHRWKDSGLPQKRRPDERRRFLLFRH